MKQVCFLLIFITATNILLAQNNDLITFYEQSQYRRTPSYEQTIDYCKKLAAASSWIHFTNFGKSPQGKDLPLIIVDINGNFTAEKVHKSGNAVLLIQACIHAGEPDGKDAGFMLLRNIIKSKDADLLKHVSIIFIPIFNVDGHERFGAYNRINQNGPEEMGWRTNSLNFNLNRDYLKCDSPEMRCWHKLFNEWLPDFSVDCHVTDGADYQYALTYSIETGGNMDQELSDWMRVQYEPFISMKMEYSGYPIFPYVQFRNWHDPRSGLVIKTAPPMLSQGYMAIQNRPGLLIESHMLKPYKTRVTATYNMLKFTLEYLNKEYKTLQILCEKADAHVSKPIFRKQDFPLSFITQENISKQVDFHGFDYTIDTSELSGGLWFKYDTTKAVVWQLKLFDSILIGKKVQLPKAYIIPPQYKDIIERLQVLGVEMTPIQEEISIPVKSYIFQNVKYASRSYEGRQKTDYTLYDTLMTRSFPKGSMMVYTTQRTAKVIAHALEPLSNDSFAAWGFFNTCMEQKEYCESYKMEIVAREMLKQDPKLEKLFEDAKSHDITLSNPEGILNWFYKRTPYWDQQLNLYPIGLIFN